MIMATQESNSGFKLIVPLDASQIEDFEPGREVKVLVQHSDGSTREETVRFSENRQGSATFTFESDPGALHIVVGPHDASAEDLLHLQTLTMDLPANLWVEKQEVTLSPISIPTYYWHWWPIWCRTYTIYGRVLCPDGHPVPGATVCAFDVDWWWWWVSKEMVGCATTDATGSFKITFRVCCGWWWWWWLERNWQLAPELAEQIVPALQRELPNRKIPIPTPRPDLAIFEELLAENSILTRRPSSKVDPAALESVRSRLLKLLPTMPELACFCLWPWCPWWPWWDCDADIIFQVTQNCEGRNKVVLNEGFFNTRWDIPTTLNVTLVTSDEACCIDTPPPPDGDCMLISQVCLDLVNNIGGNPGAAPAPVGYANPGWVAALGDRPYADEITIYGQFGNAAGVDYYEFEWATNPVGPWNSMPPAAAGGFSRSFWGPGLSGGTPNIYPISFPFTTISGHYVIESREHFEAINGPGTWSGATRTRYWVSNYDLLMIWLTKNTFADSTYYLRVKSWNLVGANLVNPRILPLCDTQLPNGLALTIDNRIVGAGSGHPLGPPHPCGTGTVHTCTTEPDTDILQVLINGVPADACAAVNTANGGTLDIDFYAHDPDGHLAYYTLLATYGVSLAIDLLAIPGATLLPGVPAGAVPSASQVGPTYANALTPPQTAVSPIWNGGTIRLHIPNIRDAFPETCCYQLQLRAYKRCIVNCDYDVITGFSNLSEFSLTIIV
jgi:hypothetical protein